MRLSRLQIANFRNFQSIDIPLSQHAIFVGENKVGKSNLIYAIRLVLDPSLPDSFRQLRIEDFWDGLPRPLSKDDRIEISVEIADFKEDPKQLAVLCEHLVSHEPMVSRLTYAFGPFRAEGEEAPKEADYEWVIYGGDRIENIVAGDVRRRPFGVSGRASGCRGRPRELAAVPASSPSGPGGGSDGPGGAQRDRPVGH